MANSDTVSRWALLIGINLYRTPDGRRHEESLRGAVADVEAMHSYLESQHKPITIIRLTATEPTESRIYEATEEMEYAANESVAFRPTRCNLDKAFDAIHEGASSGDHVYIHFSGNGTRSGQALALVLYKEEPPYQEYYGAQTFRQRLQELSQEGLKVTVVLDCCNSGGVLRSSEHATRFIEYDLEVDKASSHPASPSSTTRGPGRDPTQWEVDPNSYNIFTACGQEQLAAEIKLGEREGKEVHRGALTWILEAVLKYGAEARKTFTHDYLYDRLRIEILSIRTSQTPQRFGSGKETLFGTVQHDSKALYPSIYISQREGEEGQMYIDEGEIHGVYEGDTYDTFPFGPQPNEPGIPTQQCRVTVVEDLRARLEKISEGQDTLKIITGWRAKPLKSLSKRRVKVLVYEKAARALWGRDDPPESWAISRFAHFISQGRASESWIFALELTEEGTYKVLDNSDDSVSYMPEVMASKPTAKDDLLHILDRLVSYEFFRGIANKNPTPKIQQHVSLMSSVEKHGNDDPRPLKVVERQPWYLRITNQLQSTEPGTDQMDAATSNVYVVMFCFTSEWNVVDFSLVKEGGQFLEIAPGKSEDITVRMSPLKKGSSSDEDLFKVFITRSGSLFRSFSLSSFDARQRGQTQLSASLIEEFLDVLTTRGDDDWMTESFIVTTIPRIT